MEEAKKHILPWHHRWNVLAMTVISLTVVVGLQYCFPFWVVPWAEEFNVPHSQLLLIVSLGAVVLSLASPFAGIMYDRYPAHWLYGIGVLIVCGLYGAVSFATSHWVILLCIGLVLPMGMVLTTNLFSQLMISRWFVANRGLAMGIGALGVAFGAALLPPVATKMLSSFGWRSTFQILAICAFVILMPSGLWIFSRSTDASDVQEHGDRDVYTTFGLLLDKNFWLIAAGFGCLLMTCVAVQFSVGSYAKDLGISQQHAAYAASFSAVSLACGKLFFGKLTDLLPHRVCYWISVTIVILGIGVTSSATSFLLLSLGMVLVMFGQGCMMPGSIAMVISCFGVRSLGKVLGLLWLFIGMGAFSPYLAGLVRDLTGNYSIAYPLLTTPLLAMAIAMRSMSSKRTHPSIAAP
jgi:MFS family permease